MKTEREKQRDVYYDLVQTYDRTVSQLNEQGEPFREGNTFYTFSILS
ncbi:hypothetical protein P4637_10195 [Halalkalibacterium halodurans]|jgi:hypothetical protein|nr:hypothetical protein [Halalkalibacterium halodurans]MED3647339.1 hypothetical protein [Halalkalibacterium halodurans]MED4081645.1 hypothetical protein [Halalkalibacterium halodurans]MED4085198.1 hypothetical protein [Halalkalibacterium halodurans]MED4104170.1 hypothetical protein [Halalkalibacterium halodurans]MED4110512.1 hypothetical protein [Halalkalibacterium halodurans]